MVVFRENTEDVYAGLECEQGSAEAAKLIEFCKRELGWQILPDSGIGLKPISITRSHRLVRAAIHYAIPNKRQSVEVACRHAHAASHASRLDHSDRAVAVVNR